MVWHKKTTETHSLPHPLLSPFATLGNSMSTTGIPTMSFTWDWFVTTRESGKRMRRVRLFLWMIYFFIWDTDSFCNREMYYKRNFTPTFYWMFSKDFFKTLNFAKTVHKKDNNDSSWMLLHRYLLLFTLFKFSIMLWSKLNPMRNIKICTLRTN